MQAKQTTKDRLYWIVALSLAYLAGVLATLLVLNTPESLPWWLPVAAFYFGMLAVVPRITR